MHINKVTCFSGNSWIMILVGTTLCKSRKTHWKLVSRNIPNIFFLYFRMPEYLGEVFLLQEYCFYSFHWPLLVILLNSYDFWFIFCWKFYFYLYTCVCMWIFILVLCMKRVQYFELSLYTLNTRRMFVKKNFIICLNYKLCWF